MPSGYIISDDDQRRRYIECLSCNLRSYNFYDILNHYCSNCHLFHDDLIPDDDPDGIVEMTEH